MPRSMWRGAISFGMVAIPVRMYLATESKSVSFRMLCPSCGRPIRQKRWCPHEDREIGWTETARGYEVAKDEYVQVDDADLERLPLSTTKAVEILEFVDDKEIDAGVYIKSAYYLEPEAVGAKPYALLRRALESTGRVAIGRIALRDREHLCRLALHEDGLVLNTLHWPDEIRDLHELKLPGDDVKVDDRELEMATMLIDNLTAAFDPARHTDRYREALLQIVEEKMGQRPAEPQAEPEPARALDLMAALKASVEAARRVREEAPAAAAGEAVPAEPAGKSRRKAAAKDEAEAPARRRKAS
ncbi:MAG: Ku protein [Chloroflexi bacterium]|nr:MAG: Ku protein [Chloroflexota bacterium]